MFCIKGRLEAHYPEDLLKGIEYIDEIVAIFDTKEEAESYERRSRLSTFNPFGCGIGQHGKQYRAKSLLSRYCGAYVEPYEYDVLPHNPTISW